MKKKGHKHIFLSKQTQNGVTASLRSTCSLSDSKHCTDAPTFCLISTARCPLDGSRSQQTTCSLCFSLLQSSPRRAANVYKIPPEETCESCFCFFVCRSHICGTRKQFVAVGRSQHWHYLLTACWFVCVNCAVAGVVNNTDKDKL